MTAFENPAFDGHETVTAFHDADAGLYGFVAVHSTALGPGAGGTRFWHYDDAHDALTDVLRLSRGMSFKNAMAGLELGGGKAVIMKPKEPFDREALFEAYGKNLNRLAGTYITAEDVGVSPTDMACVARHTRFVAGLTEGKAASGDPSPVTSDGVFRGIGIAVRRRLGRDNLAGVKVAIQGCGHVGAGVCELLADAGAELVVTDVYGPAIDQVVAKTGARAVAPNEIYRQDVDVFSPCALGAIINDDSLPELQASIVAGAANNQLAEDKFDAILRDQNILYAPDYVINGGGIINVAAEISGVYDPAWVEGKLATLMDTLDAVFEESSVSGLATAAVANRMAEQRIQAAKQQPQTSRTSSSDAALTHAEG